MASISGVISRTSWMWRGGGIAARIGGVEPVDVGQQHQRVGADHLRDARGQPVVVAEADLRVATVSFSLMTGTAPSASKLSKVARALRWRRRSSVSSGVSRICATPMPCRAQRLEIGVRQPDLPGRGRGLLLLEAERARRPDPDARRPTATAPEVTTISTSCPRARQRDDVLDQRRRARRGADLAGRLVDQQRRADLDDQPARRGEALGS